MSDIPISHPELLTELQTLRRRVTELEGIDQKYCDVQARLDESQAKNQRLIDTIQDSLLNVEQIKLEWEATADSLPEVICLVDEQACILRANKAVESWGLRQVSDIKGVSIKSLLHPDAPSDTPPQGTYLNAFLRQAWQSIRQNREAKLQVYDSILKRCLEFRVRPVSRPINENQRMAKSFAVIIIRDISEHKQLEEQFRQAQKMEVIGRLAGGVAHDFNNILTVINAYTDFLMMAHAEHDDPYQADVEQIRKSSERASMLTRQLLAFSHKQPLQIKTLNLNKVVESAEKMLGRLISESIKLTIKLSPSPTLIEADISQIEQILMNLTVNARDAMPSGGQLTIETACLHVTQPLSFSLSEIPSGHYVKLTVIDNGIGMDKAVQSQIFEPFFTTKISGKGTGLGLPMVNSIVQSYNGYINLDSHPRQGTTFEIYLPQSTQPENQQPLQPQSLSHLTGTELILLVEDDIQVCQATAKMLQAYGYHLLEAHTAEEAWQVYQQYGQQIDLLITDVVLPGTSGYGLARRIESSHAEIKTLFISGYPDDILRDYGVLAPDIVHLQKPLTGEFLACQVREQLDNA